MTETQRSDGELMGTRMARPLGVLEGVRAFGVTLGGSVALVCASLASLIAALRSFAALRRPPGWAAAGIAGTAIYAFVVRPWHLRWGAKEEDAQREWPGDEFLPEGGTDIVHAVTIDAHAEEVWPWLAQIGQDRAGFYSYEWLENLAGCEMRNADSIHPEWQHRAVGETVFLHPAGGMEVTLFEPGRAIGLRNWATFVLEPLGPERTRLVSRSAVPADAFAAGYALLMEIPHFIMERRMLLGVKERAERTAPNERPAQHTSS